MFCLYQHIFNNFFKNSYLDFSSTFYINNNITTMNSKVLVAVLIVLLASASFIVSLIKIY